MTGIEKEAGRPGKPEMRWNDAELVLAPGEMVGPRDAYEPIFGCHHTLHLETGRYPPDPRHPWNWPADEEPT